MKISLNISFCILLILTVSSCVPKAVVSWKFDSIDYQKLKKIEKVLKKLNYHEIIIKEQLLPENVTMRFFSYKNNSGDSNIGLTLIRKCELLDSIEFVEGGVSEFTDEAKLQLFSLEKQLQNLLGVDEVVRSGPMNLTNMCEGKK